MEVQTPSLETENNVRTFEEKFQLFTGRLIQSAPLLCGIGIAIWWIFYGMVEIYPTELTVVERIGLTICTIFLALTYCKLISIGGFESARKTDEYKVLAKEWTDAIKKGNSQKAEIIEYAKDLARINQKELRVKNLERVGLSYCEIFDVNGNLIRLDYKKNKYDKKKNPSGFFKGQIKMIKRCVNIRIEIPEMFGNISSAFFGIQRRETQKSYERKTDIKNAVIRTVVSIFSVGLMFRWLGFSIGAVIYALFQIIMWTASGIMERMNNFKFVKNKIMPQIVENTLIIEGYLSLKDEDKAKYIEKAKEEQEKVNRKQLTYREEA